LHQEPIPLEIPGTADEHIRVDVWFDTGANLSGRIVDPPEDSADSGDAPGRLKRSRLRIRGDQPSVRLLVGSIDNESRQRSAGLNVGFQRDGGGRLELVTGTLAFPAGFEWKPGTPPSYRFFESPEGQPWSRPDFAEHRASVRRQRSALQDETTLRTFGEQVNRLATLAANLKQQKRKEAAQALRNRWEQARQLHDQAIQYTADAETWSDEMLALFDQVERELSIGYRVYIIVEGHEIDLVRTVEDAGPAS
jgi:hypothetical protein